MKKINLLVPDVHSGFVGFRKKEKVRYLSVPDNMSMKKIEEDMKIGKVIFKGLQDHLKKPACRTVVVRTNSEEVGLMAVSYLAAAYNIMDRSKHVGYNDDDELDQNGEDEYMESEEFDEDYNPIDVDEAPSWDENPSRVPILDMSEIRDFTGCDGFNTFHDRSFHMQGSEHSSSRDPYWTNCRHEPICIMISETGSFFGSPYVNYNDNVGSFFKKNRHVYIVEVRDSSRYFFSDNFLDEDGGEGREDSEFVRMVLEEAAAVVDMFYEDKANREDLVAYRVEQFKNWIDSKDLKLAKEFPTEKIVSRILKMRNQNKSELMGQIINYMQIQGGVSETVTEKDFDILKRFAQIGAETEKKKTSASKLEKQLYGMENVKQQVREIVEVLKYQKRREAFGLNKGDYHNVHLLIGAPGTAKTTVAKLMGNMMAEAHLLPGNRFTCVNGADLKGLYVGHTAPKVRQIFENNDIIMIDEAYSLVSQGAGESSDSFSQEAIAEIITQIEDHGTEKLVMFAGYGGTGVESKDNLMKNFIDANPGLKSRINSTIFFDSYTPDQMVEIAHIHAKIQGFILNRKSDELIREYFEERVKDRNFGNGREARSLLENAMVFAAERVKDIPVGKVKKRQLQDITVTDVKNAIERMRKATLMQTGRTGNKKIGFAV